MILTLFQYHNVVSNSNCSITIQCIVHIISGSIGLFSISKKNFILCHFCQRRLQQWWCSPILQLLCDSLHTAVVRTWRHCTLQLSRYLPVVLSSMINKLSNISAFMVGSHKYFFRLCIGILDNVFTVWGGTNSIIKTINYCINWSLYLALLWFVNLEGSLVRQQSF